MGELIQMKAGKININEMKKKINKSWMTQVTGMLLIKRLVETQ